MFKLKYIFSSSFRLVLFRLTAGTFICLFTVTPQAASVNNGRESGKKDSEEESARTEKTRDVEGKWVYYEKELLETFASEDDGEQQGQAAREFKINLVSPRDYAFQLQDDLHGWKHLNIRLGLPENLPEKAQIYFFTKDWDFQWRQIVKTLEGNDDEATFSLPLTGEEAGDSWVPAGHYRPWHVLTPKQTLEFGFRLEAAGEEDVERDEEGLDMEVKRIWLSGECAGKTPRVKNIAFSPAEPAVGEICQLELDIDAIYANPFKREEIDVRAEIVRPDGETEFVRGFYYEDFIREEDEKSGRLIEYGKPVFQIRYTPRAEGRHVVNIEVETGSGTTELDELSFVAQKAESDSGYKGFLRVDSENPRYFKFSSGKGFQGVGLNIRTPHDSRYLRMAPFSRWENRGIEVYRDLFPKLADAGVNVVEVWMASWWLALEWINDAPGFHGVGHFNQYRAWLMDRLVELAAEHDIYLIIVLNNHGKFSSRTDQEWKRNPYNEKNGGFLEDPEDYFSNERAYECFKRTADYIIARWGASPHILSWKLFSEINLTGSGGGFYKKPPMRDWHKEMSEYIQDIDIYDHPVTTHWSSNYKVINDSIADLESLDFLTGDAYSGKTKQVVNFFDGTADYAGKKGKPVAITEFGGPPRGEAYGVLEKQLHMSLWKGYFTQHGILPMLWWFGFVEEADVYHRFDAFTDFIEGEKPWRMSSSGTDVKGSSVEIMSLAGERRTLVCGYDKKHFFAMTEHDADRKIDDIEIVVDNLEKGEYNIEFWDCQEGNVEEVQELEVRDDEEAVSIDIPAFRRDFALKIVPR